MSYWVETSLNIPWKNIELIVDRIDKIMVDIKSVKNEIYNNYTGYDNLTVMQNLEKLLKKAGSDRVVVRIPFIQGYTTREDVQCSELFVRNLGIDNIDLFDYRISNINDNN